MKYNDNNAQGWYFIGENGEFQIKDPDENSYLYFPLTNEAGMMSSITPILHGDIKTNQNSFFMAPVSAEDLHNSKSARNFWIYINGKSVWSASGNSVWQIGERFQDSKNEKSMVEAGFLWHRLIRENAELGIRSQITSFVPANTDKVELMKVTITNTSTETMKIVPTAAIPIYGRSADNIRDHRHVTSLLHRISTTPYGIQVQRVLSFDERGHKVNHVTYFVFGAEANGKLPVGFFPVIEEFIGEGGCLDWPESIIRNFEASSIAGEKIEGYEAMGGIRFEESILKSGEEKSYVLCVVIDDGNSEMDMYTEKYLKPYAFDRFLDENIQYWKKKLDTVRFQSSNNRFDQWMRWVSLQPILRRIYGCSFLPYHDYGRGGRGWRDLWQDCLALLIMDPGDVRTLLYSNYSGVRLDGSNATIIGLKPGKFLADRNNIPRVWMDHGSWPFMTTHLYINQSGDLEFLLEEQEYFKDSLISRSKERDTSWKPEHGNKQKTSDGMVYKGTILEHILLQNLIPFYNVGQNNNILMEGADWNDAFDMADKKGESVAFTAFYANNLMSLGRLLLELKRRKGVNEIDVALEMLPLFDSISEKIDNNSIVEKHSLLNKYYHSCSNAVSGKKVKLDTDKAAKDIMDKAQWLSNHIRKNEWIKNSEGFEWFNGYYNNEGERVEGDNANGVRMTLTGQVFTVMGDIAADTQVEKVIASVNKYLKDIEIGYRLNTNFGGLQLNIGRGFGYAFGHKENGSMFSHMTVMYANSLYKRGYAKEGYAVLNSIFNLCNNFEKSRIYPGIPEYINEKGRGMYSYLTGSASWLLLTMVTEVYGIRGYLGDLQLEPKLIDLQFDKEQKASIDTVFADRKLKVIYYNKDLMNYGEYRIGEIKVDGKKPAFDRIGSSTVISRACIENLSTDEIHVIEVELIRRVL